MAQMTPISHEGANVRPTSFRMNREATELTKLAVFDLEIVEIPVENKKKKNSQSKMLPKTKLGGTSLKWSIVSVVTCELMFSAFIVYILSTYTAYVYLFNMSYSLRYWENTYENLDSVARNMVTIITCIFSIQLGAGLLLLVGVASDNFKICKIGLICNSILALLVSSGWFTLSASFEQVILTYFYSAYKWVGLRIVHFYLSQLKPVTENAKNSV